MSNGSWLPTAVGVLTFISAGLGIWTVRLDSVDRDLAARVSANETQHARIEERVEGHAATIARLRQQIVDLDSMLQREMRTLDDVQGAQLAALDGRLQQEMRLLLEKLQEQLRAIERVVFGGKEGGG